MAWRRTNSPPGFPVNLFLVDELSIDACDKEPSLRASKSSLPEPCSLHTMYTLILRLCWRAIAEIPSGLVPRPGGSLLLQLMIEKSQRSDMKRLPSDAAGDLQQAIHYYLQAAQPEEF